MRMHSYKDVESYLAHQPKETRLILEKLRRAIKKVVPSAKEGISYGMPSYRCHKVLVYFAGYKTHIGFYPTSSGVRNFKKELSKYDCSKGTVRFELDKPLPLGLIKKIVKFRFKEDHKRYG